VVVYSTDLLAKNNTSEQKENPRSHFPNFGSWARSIITRTSTSLKPISQNPFSAVVVYSTDLLRRITTAKKENPCPLPHKPNFGRRARSYFHQHGASKSTFPFPPLVSGICPASLTNLPFFSSVEYLRTVDKAARFSLIRSVHQQHLQPSRISYITASRIVCRTNFTSFNNTDSPMRSITAQSQPVLRKEKTQSAPVRILKSIPVPFSVAGILAVLVCPAFLLMDIFSGAHIMFGTLLVLVLTLLGSERRTLIALFATVGLICLAIDLRINFYHAGAELAATDKIMAMIALPLFAFGMIRKRTLQVAAKKRRPRINVSFAPAFQDRAPRFGETKTVFQHMSRSSKPMDEFTRELIWFVYVKSPKN
jgi:hypothetical protein